MASEEWLQHIHSGKFLDPQKIVQIAILIKSRLLIQDKFAHVIDIHEAPLPETTETLNTVANVDASKKSTQKQNHSHQLATQGCSMFIQHYVTTTLEQCVRGIKSKTYAPAVGLALLGVSFTASAASIMGLDSPNRIPGQFIVVLKSEVPVGKPSLRKKPNPTAFSSTQNKSRNRGFKVGQQLESALYGFTIKANDASDQANQEALLNDLANDPNVEAIVADQLIYLDETTPKWGLDRINQRKLPLDGYTANADQGLGVSVYVIDSGIRADHQEFGGRVRGGISFINDGNGLGDCRGHGTHVAGTIGGANYGVAKSVNLWSVRVFGCTGGAFTSDIVSGIDWVINNRVGPSIINMSLGGDKDIVLDTAVDNAVAAGISVVVSAGNEYSSNACSRSPAGTPSAITVGATDSADVRADYSNIGSCIDLFAPGSAITSAGIANSTEYVQKSGTSMAAPHAAGTAALYLQKNPNASPNEVASTLVTSAIPSVLTGIGTGSPNLLLHTQLTGTKYFPAPIVNGGYIGSPQTAPSGAPWPELGMTRVLYETANQFCRNNNSVGVHSFTQKYNYGAQHRYYLYGGWHTYGGIAFQQISSVTCYAKPLNTATTTNYAYPKRNAIALGSPKTQPSGAAWSREGAYGNLWQTAQQFCKDKGHFVPDYMYSATNTSGAQHSYYLGSWSTYSNRDFWELQQIRCFN